jgi:hypothetical protein
MHTIMTYLVAAAVIWAIISDNAAGSMIRGTLAYLVTGAA